MRLAFLSTLDKRKAIRYLIVGLGISLVVAIAFVIHQYPRWELMSDLRQADTVVARWQVRDGNGLDHEYAFELKGGIRKQFVAVLDENLGLDYMRDVANVVPSINLEMWRDDDSFLAGYGVRHAQGGGYFLPNGKIGGGRCPVMELLCEIASHGRRLSESEIKDLLKRPLRTKWRNYVVFDYTLPVVPSQGTYTLPLLQSLEHQSQRSRRAR